jgi:hypothetical protein
MPKRRNRGDGLSADPERPTGGSVEEMIGSLRDDGHSQEKGDVGRVAVLPAQAFAALNLGDVTMAALQAVGERVSCTAGFSFSKN